MRSFHSVSPSLEAGNFVFEDINKPQRHREVSAVKIERRKSFAVVGSALSYFKSCRSCYDFPPVSGSFYSSPFTFGSPSNSPFTFGSPSNSPFTCGSPSNSPPACGGMKGGCFHLSAQNHNCSRLSRFFYYKIVIILKAVFFIAAFLSYPSFAEVGASIRGLVTDTSGAPIAGAHIVAFESLSAAVSDWNGSFTLYNLPVGRYRLQATHLNYFAAEIEVIVHSGMTSQGYFKLEPKPYVLPEVKAIVSRPNFTSGLNTVALSKSEWTRQGVRTVSDALRLIPGVNVLDGYRTQRVSLRGAPPRLTVVELDGVPLGSAGSGETDLAGVALDRLAAIAVDFEAAGGKVKLFSQDLISASKQSAAGRLGASIGSARRCEQSGSLSRDGRLVGISLVVRRQSERGDFRYRLDDRSEAVRFNNDAAGTGGDVKTRLWSAVEAGYSFDQRRCGSPGLIYSASTPQARLNSDRRTARLEWKGNLLGTGVNLLTYGFEYSSEFINPPLQIDPSTGDTIHHFAEHNRQEGRRFGITTYWQHPTRFGRLAVGYRLQSDDYIGRDLRRGSVAVGVGNGSAKRVVQQLESSWRWTKDWTSGILTAEPTVKMERIDNRGYPDWTLITVSGTLGWEQPCGAGQLSINTGWGRILTPPAFNALFLVENMFAVGNPRLKPETGEGGQISIYYNLQKSLADFSFSAAGFHRRLTDMIIWRRGSFNKYYPANIARARSTGYEISAQIAICNNRFGISNIYMYNDNRNDTPGDINRGHFVPLSPLHSGNAVVSANWKSLHLSLRSRWASRRYSTESNMDPISTAGMGLPPYTLWDVSVSFNRDIWRVEYEVDMGINNLCDRDYRIVERSPTPGRMFIAGVELKFGL